MLATQVVLAQSLGVTGRGTVAAATAPLMLAAVFFTLGLPEALTFLVARGGAVGRPLALSVLALAVSGCIGSGIIALLALPLSVGNHELARLIILASVMLVPALLTAALRGVAFGAHKWWLVAAERSFGATLQLIAVWVLSVSGSLTPITATAAIAGTTFAGAILYLVTPQWWGALGGRMDSQDANGAGPKIASYAWRCWVGSMAGILLVRLDQVLMTPLAGIEQLGIYVVAANVSMVALLFNSAVTQVTFAVESGEQSSARVGRAARTTTLVTAVVGIGLIGSSPWMVPLLFGSDFAPAVPVLVILVLEICIAIPGSVAGAALNARGRPGLRSLSLSLGMAVYLVAMIVLVPMYGAIGAAVAMAAGTILPGYLAIYWLHRSCGVQLSEFYKFRKTDFYFFGQLMQVLRSKN